MNVAQQALNFGSPLLVYKLTKMLVESGTKLVRTDRQTDKIWITAAKFGRGAWKYGYGGQDHRSIDRSINSLAANGVEINREHWLKEAVDAEKAG